MWMKPSRCSRQIHNVQAHAGSVAGTFVDAIRGVSDAYAKSGAKLKCEPQAIGTGCR